MAVLRFTTMDNGALCAMITGISKMLMWYVVSWASLVHPPLLLMQDTARGLFVSGWMMSTVAETRHRYFTVIIKGGNRHLTVITARMQV